jgi:tRNA pseudouridine38-40 synthase
MLPTQRIALGIAYDGAEFCGWQIQPHVASVQAALESVLQQFLGHPCPTVCAGRTDTGVHANAQVVHVDTPQAREPESWVRALNTYLPHTVSVHWAEPVTNDFNARLSATAREYAYAVLDDPVRPAQLARQVGWLHRPLALQPMQQAAQYLVGTHDFSAFRSSECQAASPVRTLEFVNVERKGRLVVVRLRGNAFLHHMVRNIVGCLVYVGMGRWPAEKLKAVLEGKDRAAAAPTFSPAGLYLARVEYPDHFGLPAVAGPPPWWELATDITTA